MKISINDSCVTFKLFFDEQKPLPFVESTTSVGPEHWWDGVFMGEDVSMKTKRAFVRMILWLAISPVFCFAELQDTTPRLQNLEARLQQYEAAFAAKRREVQGNIDVVNQNLSRLKYGTLEYADNQVARGNYQNQLTDLRVEESNTLSPLRREINEAKSEAHWITNRARDEFEYKGRTIEPWVQNYRIVDNVLQTWPQENPAVTLRVYQQTSERFASGTEAETAAWKKTWQTDSVFPLINKFNEWQTASIKKVEALPDEPVKKRVRAALNPLRSDLANVLNTMAADIKGELDERAKFRDKVSGALEALRMRGGLSYHAEGEASQVYSAENARRDAVVRKVSTAWSGVAGGDGGASKRWEDFKLAEVIAKETAAFKDYRALKDEYLKAKTEAVEKLEAEYLSWFGSAQEELVAFKNIGNSLLTGDPSKAPGQRGGEPHEHIRRPVGKLFAAELTAREIFVAQVQTQREAVESRQKVILDAIFAAIDQAYEEKKAAKTIREELDPIFAKEKSTWAPAYAAWHAAWNDSTSGELKRQSNFSGVDVLIARERARYPLRAREGDCAFLYEMRLDGAKTYIVSIDPNVEVGKDLKGVPSVPLLEMEGRRSFSCHKQDAVLIADTIYVNQAVVAMDAKNEVLKKTIAQMRTKNGNGWMVAFSGKELVAAMGVPDEGLAFDKVEFQATPIGVEGFVLRLRDPVGALVEDFAPVFDPASREMPRLEAPVIKKTTEVWDGLSPG
jgi:hypothetical protein